MADLNKLLKIEETDRTSWQADRNRRQNHLAGKSSNDNYERSILRQLTDNNEHRDFAENILLRIIELDVVQDAGENKFNEASKTRLIKTLRGLLLSIYEQKAYLKTAEKYGYVAAEEFKSSDPDDKAVDDNIKARMNDIAKRYTAKQTTTKANKDQKKPYYRDTGYGGYAIQQPLMVQPPQTMQAPYMMQSPQTMQSSQMMQSPQMVPPMLQQQMMQAMLQGGGGLGGYRPPPPQFYGGA